MYQYKIRNHSSISRLLWILVLAQTIFLALYYSDNRRPDVFHYIDNAELLLQGRNPYLDGTARWGAVGPLIFIPISRNVSELQLAQFIIFASSISIILFFKYVINVEKQILPMVVSATLFLSPVRELFALGQINAVCVGFLSASVALSKIHLQKRAFNIVRNLCISSMSVIAIDLKPHVMLLVSFLLYSHFLTRKFFGHTLVMLVSGHVIVDLIGNRFYELDWLNIIYSQSNEYLISESKNLSGLLTLTFGDFESLMKFISAIFYCLVAVLILTRKQMSFCNQVLFASLASFLLPYFHYYDLLIPTLIFITNIVTQKSRPKYFEWILLFLLTIPERTNSIVGLLSLLAITAIVLVIRRNYLEDRTSLNLRKIPVPFVVYLSITESLKRIANDNFTYQATLNTIIVIAILVLFWGNSIQRFKGLKK